MNKFLTYRFVLFLVLCNFYLTNAQQSKKQDLLNKIPEEQIFAHLNSTLFISGESLLYKIYCKNTQTKQLSGISKVAYVELINNKSEVILKQKVKLNAGNGSGDLFINSSIPSGNYKLIVYTQWMRNNTKHPFFESDILIINPFRTNPRIIATNILNTDSTAITKNNSSTKEKNYTKIDTSYFVEFINDKNEVVHKQQLNSKNKSISINKPLAYGDYKIVTSSKVTKNNVSLKDTLSISKSVVINTKKPKNNTNKEFTTNHFSIKTNNATYNHREKVTVKINSNTKNTDFGNYSISIRKVDTVLTPDKQTTTWGANYVLENTQNNFYIPEMRGELLIGKVMNQDNTIANNVPVALSISGKNFIFKITNTDANGVFYFNIDKEYTNLNAQLYIVGKNETNAKIVLDKYQAPNYAKLNFNNLKLSKKHKAFITERGIKNQIENYYTEIKSDSVLNAKPKQHFYYTTANRYNLDDFTRFKTVRETIVEFVDDVSIIKQDGKYGFNVKILSNQFGYIPPLILIDGVLIEDQEILYNFNPKEIKFLNVVRDNYNFGKNIFGGLIAVETIKRDYKPEKIISDLDVALTKPTDKKIFYTPNYDTENLKRIPDYRYQLYWNPDLKIKDTAEITFFTSDNKGKYEISLEGYTIDGKPVSEKKFFTVK